MDARGAPPMDTRAAVSGGDGGEEGSMPVFVPGWNDGGRIIGIQGQIDLGSSILAAVKDREEG